MRYAVCGYRRLAGALLVVLVGMAVATPGAPGAELKGKALVEALQDGGYNIYFRHAPTDWGQHDRRFYRKNLKAANCLILLVPDDNEREWPIFEAGIFMGRMLPGQRLICLYHPDVAIPSQLAMFQGYKANKLGVQELLRKALLEPNFIPGMPAVNPNCEAYIESSAATIVSEFTGPLELRARPTMFYITLELSAPGHLSGPSELLRARVIKAAGLQQMFGYNGEIGCELSRLIDVSGGAARHDAWLNELTEVIQKEMQYRAAEVPFAKFATPDRTRFYRPVLRQLEEQNGVTHRAEICFGEHVIGVAENPDDLQVVEAALRLRARFRTEVLERFSTPRNSEDVSRFERVLKRIEREAFDEGFREPSLLVELFEGKDRETLEKMYADWER